MFGSYVDELVSYAVAKPRKSAVRYYASSNSLYSIAATTNTAGQVVERYSYNAYGVRTVKNSAGATLAMLVVKQDRGFTGYKVDGECGIYFARGRLYSPKLGRFLSRDLIGYLDGYNPYGAYFIPNARDPSGLIVEIVGPPADQSALQDALAEIADTDPRLRAMILELYNNKKFKVTLSLVNNNPASPYSGDYTPDDQDNAGNGTGSGGNSTTEKDKDGKLDDDSKATLTHELFHAWESFRGTLSGGTRQLPGGRSNPENVDYDEEDAQKAANILLKKKKKPLREKYSGFTVHDPEKDPFEGRNVGTCPKSSP